MTQRRQRPGTPPPPVPSNSKDSSPKYKKKIALLEQQLRVVSKENERFHVRILEQSSSMQMMEQQNTLNQLKLKGLECALDNAQIEREKLEKKLHDQAVRIRQFELKQQAAATKSQKPTPKKEIGGQAPLRRSSTDSVGSLSNASTHSQSVSMGEAAVNVSEIQQWLFQEGAKSTRVQPWMTEYCQRLREEFGIPIDRLIVTDLSVKDPEVYCHVWMWTNDQPFQHESYSEEEFVMQYLSSMDRKHPFRQMYDSHSTQSMDTKPPAKLVRLTLKKNSSRHNQQQNPEGCPWFYQGGYTDYLSLPVMHHGRFAGTVAWATQHEQGFTRPMLEFFEQSMAGLSLVVRLQTNEVCMEHILRRLEDKVEKRTLELQQANCNLEEANQRIQKQAQAQLRHFAMMSHEIRTPLNCIIGLTNLLLEDATPDQQENLRMMAHSGDLLLGVVDDVLNFSRLAVGEVQFHWELIDLQDCIGSVLQAVQLRARQDPSSNAEIRTRWSPALPQRFESDGRRLQQILYNLVGNAMKFGARGKYVDVQVDVAPSVSKGMDSTPTAQMLVFSVQDYGCGIDPSHIQNIFQPFQQGSKDTEREFGGTGLGLAITNNLIRAMGGSIRVESEYGKWTKFTVHLPLRKPQARIVLKKVDSMMDTVSRSSPCSSLHPEASASSVGSWTSKTAEPSSSITPHDPDEERGQNFPSSVNVSLFRPISKPSSGRKEDSLSPNQVEDTPSAKVRSPKPANSPEHSKNKAQAPPSLFAAIESQPVGSVDPTPLFATTVEATPASISLPAATSLPTETKAPVRRAPEDTNKSFPDWSHLQVLVAEDNKINQKVVKRILQRAGIDSVVLADNGKLAVDKMSATNDEDDFDLILMDLEMPVMNGLEATKQIVAQRRTAGRLCPSIVFLSAHALDEYKQQAREAGGVNFLSKPLKLEILQQALMELDLSNKVKR